LFRFPNRQAILIFFADPEYAAQAVTIPLYGRLADLYGRRRVFFFGTGLFLVGTTLAGFARSIEVLILFRAIQGLGAGAIATTSSASSISGNR
jgi:MFS family permease